MKRLLIILFALLSALVLTGCATRRQLQVVDRITRDTIYQSNLRYDSVYISHDRTTDYHRGVQSNESAESVQSVSSVFSDNCQQNPSAINNQQSAINSSIISQSLPLLRCRRGIQGPPA